MVERIDQQDLKKCLQTLHEGGLILYPTDTIWGIGCDALQTEAIERIYTLKGRDRQKPLIILLENENQLQSYVKEVPEIAYQLIEYSDRPLTIIYSGAKNLPESLIGEDGSIGIRIVKEPFCQELIRRFRRPIVSTSANLSGQPTATNFADITDAVRHGVDYIVDYGRSNPEPREPSILMKLDSSGAFEFIRK